MFLFSLVCKKKPILEQVKSELFVMRWWFCFFLLLLLLLLLFFLFFFLFKKNNLYLFVKTKCLDIEGGFGYNWSHFFFHTYYSMIIYRLSQYIIHSDCHNQSDSVFGRQANRSYFFFIIDIYFSQCKLSNEDTSCVLWHRFDSFNTMVVELEHCLRPKWPNIKMAWWVIEAAVQHDDRQ